MFLSPLCISLIHSSFIAYVVGRSILVSLFSQEAKKQKQKKQQKQEKAFSTKRRGGTGGRELLRSFCVHVIFLNSIFINIKPWISFIHIKGLSGSKAGWPVISFPNLNHVIVNALPPPNEAE